MSSKALVVAKFEYLKTVRRRGFIISALALPVVMLIILGLTTFAGISGGNTTAPVPGIGYVDHAGVLVPSQGFTAYSDEQAGKQALLDGKISQFLVVGSDYLATGKTTVYSLQSPLTGSGNPANAVGKYMTANLLRYGNVSDVVAAKIESPVQPDVITLDKNGNVKSAQDALSFLLPFGISIFLAIGILTSSGYLMQGIGEEKESRRGEFLLSRLSAEQLLAGKILGYGCVCLTQMAIWAGIGLLVLFAGPFSSLFAMVQLSWLVYLAVLYFILGFFLFAVSIACAASLASSVREAQQVSAVFTMFAIWPIVFLQFLLQDPNSPILQLLTFFPYTSPFITMARMTMTEVPAYELVLSIAILVLSIALLTKLSARIFRMGMLTYGKKPGIRDIIGFLRVK
jgi:ABC-2 type transport system permease protein